MKLLSVRIREFKSIWDTGAFDIAHVTCLVGKNEAGKTAVLQALYRLNPIVEGDEKFDPTDDYPRSAVEDYQQDIEAGKRQPGVVVKATFTLDHDELQAIESEYGPKCLSKSEVELSRGYAKDKKSGRTTLFVELPVSEAAVVQHLLKSFEIPDGAASSAGGTLTLADLHRHLSETSAEQEQARATAVAAAQGLSDESARAAALELAKGLAESEQQKALRTRVATLVAKGDLSIHIWQTHLRANFPKFLYFDEYYQLQGHDNVQRLKQRVAANTLQKSDHPLLGLIELARLDLDGLLRPTRTQELKNKLQGASNHLSSQVLKYWSQNKHLQMQFDVRHALPEDPEGMREGTNIWGEVYDSKHLVSTGIATRSRGFVWFFSFLSWYSAVKKRNEPLVLLLDEPGMSLHGKAQDDLLRYFETEVASNPRHQLIYTTHSPFMVDAQHFDRVRIVQDTGIDSDEELPKEESGTKVFTDVLRAQPDSLFPLQGALGYEIFQTLFIGPNSLVVEGVSDLLYVQAMSELLGSQGRTALDDRWTITPVGGSDRVPSFVSLIGSQKSLRVATLVDFQKSDRQTVENLYKRKLLKRSHVLTFADFTGTHEADIEDMFGDECYLDLVSQAYGLEAPLTTSDLKGKSSRVLVRLEQSPRLSELKPSFSHYRPARLFAESASKLKIPKEALDRFEAAFTTLNGLLSRQG
jgi:hypothetical protein